MKEVQPSQFPTRPVKGVGLFWSVRSNHQNSSSPGEIFTWSTEPSYWIQCWIYALHRVHATVCCCRSGSNQTPNLRAWSWLLLKLLSASVYDAVPSKGLECVLHWLRASHCSITIDYLYVIFYVPLHHFFSAKNRRSFFEPHFRRNAMLCAQEAILSAPDLYPFLLTWQTVPSPNSC